MNTITINFNGVGYNNYYQPYIIVINNDNEIIYKGYTYNGIIELCLKNNELYKLNAYLNNRYINKVFISDKCNNKMTFSFNNIRIITFLLTDSNYKNLKIKKGELILCQK